MKKAWMVIGLLGYFALTSQPVQAKCVPLIKEAREQLTAATLSKSEPGLDWVSISRKSLPIFSEAQST